MLLSPGAGNFKHQRIIDQKTLDDQITIHDSEVNTAQDNKSAAGDDLHSHLNQQMKLFGQKSTISPSASRENLFLRDNASHN